MRRISWTFTLKHRDFLPKATANKYHTRDFFWGVTPGIRQQDCTNPVYDSDHDYHLLHNVSSIYANYISNAIS